MYHGPSTLRDAIRAARDAAVALRAVEEPADRHTRGALAALLDDWIRRARERVQERREADDG